MKKADVLRLARALGVAPVGQDSLVRLFARCLTAAEQPAPIDSGGSGEADAGQAALERGHRRELAAQAEGC